MKIKEHIITAEVTWDMAHRFPRYSGACANVHGHTYKLRVAVKGECTDGMVADFKYLKQCLETVKSKFDHKCVLEGDSPEDIKLVHVLREIGSECYTPGYRPTAENMAAHIAEMLVEDLNLNVAYVKLWETPTNCAEVVL